MSMSSFLKFIRNLAVASFWSATAFAQAQSGWTPKDWDPANSKPDMILPLPCGGGIAMRRVETPTEANWLADIKVRFGTTASFLPYTDFIWNDSVVGSLADGAHAEKRHYYIGVYEITERQQAAVMNDCATAMNIPAGLPVEDATWFDAISFAEKLNKWIYANAPDVLAALGTDGGFVRLPTEAEWEFAARGGMAVQDEETRRAPMFPLDAPIENYAHHLGRTSCDGLTQPIGAVRPNPLNLYDVVGNVREFVQEPFRLNAHGRLHGQAGAFVARGGSCLTPREEVTIAQREELPVIDRGAGGLYRGDYTGFRIAIVGASRPESISHKELISDFENLSAFVTEEQPDKTEERLVSKATDEETVRLIENLTANFRNEIAQRELIHRRSIRLSIISGAFMARSYFVDSEGANRLRSRCQPPGDLAAHLVTSWKNACNLSRQYDERRKLTRSLYGDLVVQMAGDVSKQNILEQFPHAAESLKRSDLAHDFASLFVCQIIDYAQSAPTTLDNYFIDIENRNISRCSN